MTLELDRPTLPTTATGLRAVILLTGGSGPSSFERRVGRSLLDLPGGARRSVFDLWMRQFRALAREPGMSPLRVLVAVAGEGPSPLVRPRPPEDGLHVAVVRDRHDYRGTAGVVRDLTRRFAPRDRVLVLAASQLPLEPLRATLDAIDARGEDEGVRVTTLRGSDVSLAFLLRCDHLRGVADEGFVDLKEQALRADPESASLAFERAAPGTVLSLRTLDGYVRALRLLSGDDWMEHGDDPYAETWRPAFSIVETGAVVGPGAVLHDSVVLSGGRVEPGAVVARSVVGPSGVVRRGRCVADAVVTGDE